MPPETNEEIRAKLQDLRSRIRQIAHDISSPLGVLRLAVHYLQVGEPDEERRRHYIDVMNQTVGKVEANLDRLRALIEELPAQAGEGAPPDETRT